MALRSELRTAIRYNIDDPAQWSETEFSPDPTRKVYQIPRLGPMLLNTESIDIDGVAQVRNVDYVPYYDAAQIKFTNVPVGGSIHIIWQFARFTEENLNAYINEAIRELAFRYPRFGKYHRLCARFSTTTTDNPLSATATTINVASTTSFDSAGMIQLGGTEWVYHTGKTATSFTGCQRQWSGIAVSQASGTAVVQDDSINKGFFVGNDDGGRRVRYIWGLRWYDSVTGLPSDSLGYVDTGDFHYDRADGFLTLEGDFDVNDNFEVLVGTYYNNPTDDVTALDVPDEAFDAVGWLAAANALAAREADRDLAAIENKIVDTQGNPPGAVLKTADNFRKKYDNWASQMYRAFPSRQRRIFAL